MISAYNVVCGELLHLFSAAQKGGLHMKLELFDDMDGLILHERENSLSVTDMRSGRPESPETSRLPKDMPLAMAYVPFQQWGDVHSSEDALESGTLFPDLVFPFGKGGGR